ARQVDPSPAGAERAPAASASRLRPNGGPHSCPGSLRPAAASCYRSHSVLCCALWITFRCGGKNAFGARTLTLFGLVPSWLVVVIHNCGVLCRLSGCHDKIVVSVGRRSPPLTARGSWSTAKQPEGGG